MQLPILSMMIFLGVLGSVAEAADACKDPQNQATMTECAGKEFKAADAQLNAEYKQIVKRLADDAETKKLLVASQRAWIAFRDAECDFQSSGASGGSIHPMIYAGCMTTVTNARLADFKTYLNCEEGEVSCPVPAEQ